MEISTDDAFRVEIIGDLNLFSSNVVCANYQFVPLSFTSALGHPAHGIRYRSFAGQHNSSVKFVSRGR